MRIPRVSTRRLMVVVLAMALGLGLGLPAAEVYATRESHPHGFVGRSSDGAPWAAHEENVADPFWARYRLRLIGQPWRHLPVCLAGKSRLEEICSIEAPEHFMASCLSSYVFLNPTIEMRRTIRKRNGLKPDPRLEALVNRP